MLVICLPKAQLPLSGQKLPRSGLSLDPNKAMQSFADLAHKLSGAELLRVYWYDGTSTGPTAQHLSLAHLDNVKMRLGFVNSVGEQKGVDSLIVTDMIALARNRAMSDAVLLSGDEDLRVGVQQAQEFGVRVHLLGIRPSRGSQSLFLLQEADTTLEWTTTELSSFLSLRPAPQQSQLPTPQPVAQPTEGGGAAAPVAAGPNDATVVLQGVAVELAGTVEPSELEALVTAIQQSGQTPREIDGRLLAKSKTRLGVALDSHQKRQVRAAFLSACEKRLRAPNC